MTRRVVPLTPDRLRALGETSHRAGPSPCASCVAWELSPADVGRLGGCSRERASERAAEKSAWLSQVLRDWGSCGRVVLVEGEPVGHVLYAPPALVPGSGRFATSPVAADAVVLASIHVDAAHTGHGLGRLLVQHLARDLLERGGVRAVEAFGGTTATAVRRECVPPSDFLARVGFGTVREHPSVPRMRMDLRSALTWRDEVEAALERLRGVVRPAARPAPTRSGSLRSARPGSGTTRPAPDAP